jgi:peptide/nickel transport system substrate-binding protein
LLVAALVLSACAAPAPVETGTEPKTGGIIQAALAGDPTTLDSGVNSGSLTITVAQNIFETLFVLDQEFTVRPMLAEGFVMSDDGLTYTIELRPDVPFQNGEILDSADVVASLERWMKVSGTGMQIAANVTELVAVDELTIEVTLATPSYSFIGALANSVQAAIILPEEIASTATIEPLTTENIIGTGPYSLESYTPGTSVELVRFEDYASRTETDWTGAAGAKEQYADGILFSFVPDPTQRSNGIRTGLWDWVQSINADEYDTVREDPAFTVEPSNSGLVHTLLLNNNESSVFSDVEARHALSLLIDKEALATATFGPEWTWAPLTPAMVVRQNGAMFSDVGAEVFSAHDPEAAAEMFAEAGVDEGDTIRILSTQTYPFYNQMAVIIQEQLAEIGIEAVIETYDFPTMIERLSSAPTEWDISMTSFSGAVTAPGQVLWLGPSWPGGYSSEKMTDLIASFELSATPEEAHDVIDRIQELVYEDMPVIQLGAGNFVAVYSSSLQMRDPSSSILWNAWLTD